MDIEQKREKQRIYSKRSREKMMADPVRREVFLERKRQWEARHRSEKKEIVRAYYNSWLRANRERTEEQQREYRRRPEVVARRKEMGRRRYAEDKDYRDKLLSAGRKKTAWIRDKVIDLYGGYCVCCGENHVAFLTIDHINGDGSQQRKSDGSRGGANFYRSLLKLGVRRIDLQVLCNNCNIAKWQFGECPHKTVAEFQVRGLG